MIKKIITLLILIVLAVGTIIAIPFFFKDKINVLLKEQINKELKVSVDYSEYDLTILSSFPDFKFVLKDLVVIGEDKFEGDTLAMMKELNFNLDAKKIYQEQKLQIHTIYIDELNMKAYILSDSANSFDVLKEKNTEVTKIDTTKERVIDINLESLIVKNSNIYYTNALNKQTILLKGLNLNTTAKYLNEKASIIGDSQIEEIIVFLDTENKSIGFNKLDFYFTGDYESKNLHFDLNSFTQNLSYQSKSNSQTASLKDVKLVLNGSLKNNILNINPIINTKATSFQQKDTKYLNDDKLSLKGNIIADLKSKSYFFNKNKLNINDLIVDYDGRADMVKKGMNLDFKFNTTNSSFKSLMSIIPKKYLEKKADAEIKGNFNLNGYAKGILGNNLFPIFNFDLKIIDGFLKNASLPSAIEDINMDLKFSSNDNHMNRLDLIIPNAHLSINKEPLDISFKMLDIKNNPFIDLKAKGKFDLEKLPSFYKIADLKKIDGNIDMDISFKGKKDDIKNKNFKDVDFQGDMKIVDLIYETKKTKKAIEVKTMNLDFNPQYANMTNLDLKYGKTKIKATGKLENVIDYVFSDGILNGKLDFNSHNIDLYELLGKSTSVDTKTTSTTEKEATKVPKRINFTTTATIKELKYDDVLLNNVKGKIIIKDEAVNIKAITANMLGGKAKINGVYTTKNTEKPVIDFKYDVKNFDIKQTFKKVNTIQKIAPILEFLDGKFNSTFSFNSKMQNDYKPDMTLLNGLGNVTIPYASFLNFPIFNSVSKAIKIPLLDLDQASIKNAWTVFKIREGRVDVEPFDYEFKDIKMNVFGSNGFDKSINYTMKVTVPSNKFGGAAGIANDFLKNNNIPLLNLSVPKNITFHLNLSGFLQNPKVKILKVTADGSNKGIVEQVTDDIKDKAKEEAEKIKKEAEKRAKEAAEKLKKELEERLKKELEDKLKKELEDKLKKEMEDKLKKESENILDDILKDKLPNFGF